MTKGSSSAVLLGALGLLVVVASVNSAPGLKVLNVDVADTKSDVDATHQRAASDADKTINNVAPDAAQTVAAVAGQTRAERRRARNKNKSTTAAVVDEKSDVVRSRAEEIDRILGI